MGDFVPSSPKSIPTEWRPRASHLVSLNGPGQAVAMRIRPGAVTLSHIHAYLAQAGDGGLGIEVVDSLQQLTDEDIVFPAVDVLTTSWSRSSGSASFFTYVDDFIDTSDYLFTTTAGASLLFRSSAAALTSWRIRFVEIEVAAAVGSPAFSGQVQMVVNIGGTTYAGPAWVPVATPAVGVQTWRMYVNPSTLKPWTLAQANAFRSAGADSFGLRMATVSSSIPTIYSVRLRTGLSVENRVGGFFYGNSAELASGWKEYALTSPAALSANTWYHLLVWSFGAGGTPFKVPVLSFPEAIDAASASASTGEHRRITQFTTDGAGDAVGSLGGFVIGDMLPALLDSSGTIRSQSQPYAELLPMPVYSGFPSPQLGQEITTSGASTPYGAVRVACGYQTVGRTPDAPLLVKVRTTSFTGTVQATATIQPSDLGGGALQDVQKAFNAVYTPPTSTKIFVTIESAATNGAGWQVVIGDQRSDAVSGTTASEVQGAGFGGTTDAASPSGSTRDQRYDLALSIVSSPTAPATLIPYARAAL